MLVVTGHQERVSSRRPHPHRPRGEQLDAWIATAGAGDQPDLRSFITGLKRDYQAVLNGLALPYSSGKVEGNVNRIILWNQNCQAGPA